MKTGNEGLDFLWDHVESMKNKTLEEIEVSGLVKLLKQILSTVKSDMSHIDNLLVTRGCDADDRLYLLNLKHSAKLNKFTLLLVLAMLKKKEQTNDH